MINMNRYFLAIIGGGPAGYTAAEKASKAGRDVVQIVEELIRVANHNGGKDNIAVVIIEPFADEVR